VFPSRFPFEAVQGAQVAQELRSRVSEGVLRDAREWAGGLLPALVDDLVLAEWREWWL